MGRGNFAEYNKAAARMLNFRPIATGGLVRRDGFLHVAVAAGEGRIIPFEASDENKFIILLTTTDMHVYDTDGALKMSRPFLITMEKINNIRYAQKDSSIYLVEENIHPCMLRYNKIDGTFTFTVWNFETRKDEHGRIESLMPFAKFPDMEGVVLTIDSTTNTNRVIITSRAFFKPEYVGVRLQLFGGQVEILSVVNETTAACRVVKDLDGGGSTTEWREEAFSFPRGYPRTLAFYQNRMVLGGARELPGRMWFSKTAKYFDFDLGEGLDDEAIEFDMLSEKSHKIVAIFEGKHLQVFTDDAEWVVAGNPITPTSIEMRIQTRIGSKTDVYIEPQLVEGSTIFIAKNGNEAREFYWGEIEGGYVSNDLASLSPHMLDDPIQQSYNKKTRTLHILNRNGKISADSINKNMGVNAWHTIETAGEIKSICNIDEALFALVKRGETFRLERLDKRAVCDACLVRNYESAQTEISGLEHLDGMEVIANADGEAVEAVVENGMIILETPAKNVSVGLAFVSRMCPLPPFVGMSRMPRATRLIVLTMRVSKTRGLKIDTGQGAKNHGGESEFTGDIRIVSRGFVRNFETPVFKIETSAPFKAKILNITATMECVI